MQGISATRKRPRLQSRAVQRAVVLTVLFTTQDASARELHHSPHLDETNQLAGINGILASGFEDGESEFGGGLGLFYERTLIEGWLELEINPSFLWVESVRVFSMEQSTS